MPLAPRRLLPAIWSRFPEPIRRWAGSASGTQITYFICFSLLAMTGRTAGAAGWLAGAAVSYGVSRWAWERKGKPRVFRETLPFVAVSLVVGIVLTEASHFGYREAAALGLHGAAHDAFVQGFYLTANCFTFLTRFVIFHFVLFADRGAKADSKLGVEDA